MKMCLQSLKDEEFNPKWIKGSKKIIQIKVSK